MNGKLLIIASVILGIVLLLVITMYICMYMFFTNPADNKTNSENPDEIPEMSGRLKDSGVSSFLILLHETNQTPQLILL